MRFKSRIARGHGDRRRQRKGQSGVGLLPSLQVGRAHEEEAHADTTGSSCIPNNSNEGERFSCYYSTAVASKLYLIIFDP